MNRKIKVSLLYNDEVMHVTLPPCAEDPSVIQVIGAALNLVKEKGMMRISTAAYVAFDMDTGAEIPLQSTPLRGITHVGFYPKKQGFMADATPALMAKAFLTSRKPKTSKKANIAAIGPDPALVEAAENRAREYLSLGMEAEKKRAWEVAVECYRKVFRINPVDPVTRYSAFYNMAHSLMRLKQFAEAAGYAHAAVAVSREQHAAYNLLGIIYSTSGMYQDASWYWMAAAGRALKSKVAWLNLQALLAKHPALLADVPYLAETVEATRKVLETRGQLPKAH